MKSLHLASPHLQTIEIVSCNELINIELVDAPTPSLRALKIQYCKQLKVLQIAAHLTVGLEGLTIMDCPELELWESQDKLDLDSLSNLRRCSMIRVMHLSNVGGVLIEQLLLLSSSSLQEIFIFGCRGPFSFPSVAFTSLRECDIIYNDALEILPLASPRLQKVYINHCVGLTSVEIEAPTPSLSYVRINGCSKLRNLRIAHHNALEVLETDDCPELLLSTSVYWDR